jgi:hypothetical protein
MSALDYTDLMAAYQAQPLRLLCTYIQFPVHGMSDAKALFYTRTCSVCGGIQPVAIPEGEHVSIEDGDTVLDPAKVVCCHCGGEVDAANVVCVHGEDDLIVLLTK